MKAAEIDIGESYAFAESSADHDLFERRVTKVEVVKTPASGKVEVKLLEDGKTRIATRYDEPMPVAGDNRRVKTRQLIMPWSRYEARLKNIADQKAERDKNDLRKAARLRRIQERLDRIVPQSGRNHDVAWLSYDEGEVTMPTAQLERLLGAADHTQP